MQRVLVLAAGLETTIERNKDKGRRYTSRLLTVSVNLQEAQMLTLAQSIGKLSVIVRNVDDPHVVDDAPDVNRDELFQMAARRQPTTVKAAPQQRPVPLKPGAR